MFKFLKKIEVKVKISFLKCTNLEQLLEIDGKHIVVIKIVILIRCIIILK